MYYEEAVGVYYKEAVGVYYEEAVGVYYEEAVGVYYEEAVGVYYEEAVGVYQSVFGGFSCSNLRDCQVRTLAYLSYRRKSARDKKLGEVGGTETVETMVFKPDSQSIRKAFFKISMVHKCSCFHILPDMSATVFHLLINIRYIQ